MVRVKRSYQAIIADHFARHRQMAFITGPRQVGKTTLSMSIGKQTDTRYLNWDDPEDRDLLLTGSASMAEHLALDKARAKPLTVIFDEIHKYSGWKQFVKGFYDRYKDRCNIIVTGSARMDSFRKGGDSLMGRYFNYRLHPLSVAELLNGPSPENEYGPQRKLSGKQFQALLQWGGFPDPFIKRDQRFYNRWSRLREQQLIREDIREMTRVQELDQLEMLALLLKNQAGQLTGYTSLAKKIRVSVDTIRRWVLVLESLYYCFTVRPWSRNITRSILKEPKYFLWDWSQCDDEGALCENFIASHLLKAAHFWTDTGLGNYDLYYVRDKEKREVDFLVTKNRKPWMLVEAKKSSGAALSPGLRHFSKALNVSHAFQAVVDDDYEDVDVFSCKTPVIVPAGTLLSQLC
ncbi:MAG: ATP-binding protein [Candidatus Dadabacteria bacterium]|nr:ATP-binding protein [Candidatus Dadabacteria bacterium]